MPLCATSSADPYLLPDLTESFLVKKGYDNTRGRTQVSSLLAAPASTAVIVTAGQSNICSTSEASAYTPSNAAAHNFNIHDGGIYAGADPVLGAHYIPALGVGSANLRIADKLITSGAFTRVIMVPIGMGASLVAQWAPGGVLHDLWRVTLARLAALGLSPNYFIWQQGESDALAGTSSAAYTAALQSIVTALRALGSSAKFFVALGTYRNGAANATIRTGQGNAVSAPLNIIQGPDTDTLTGANRMADATHFSAAGLEAQAELWKATILGNL